MAINKYTILIIVIQALISMPETARSQEYYLNGQISAWGAVRYEKSWASQAGLRYIPEFKFDIQKEKLIFSGEFSANATTYVSSPATGNNPYGRIKPYRAWLKISSDQFELRAGLQKINFGSATMLRSMMWFDKIDPRDPLQMTDGVYGILGRYYFLNNANIWLWSLAGNKNPKGLDTYGSDPKRPEFGGRIQLPMNKAELAFSYHNRLAVDTSSYYFPGEEIKFNEQKFGFDAKADVVVGLWLEYVLKRGNLPGYEEYQEYFTAGTDYTFGIGNGLHLTAEYLNLRQSDKPFSTPANSYSFLGFSGNYPLNIFSSISGMLYVNPNNGDIYRFLNLSLTFDRFSYYLIGFWNPSEFQLFNMENESVIFTGKGIQFMAVFNY
jgi:hypothetical protein